MNRHRAQFRSGSRAMWRGSHRTNADLTHLPTPTLHRRNFPPNPVDARRRTVLGSGPPATRSRHFARFSGHQRECTKYMEGSVCRRPNRKSHAVPEELIPVFEQGSDPSIHDSEPRDSVAAKVCGYSGRGRVGEVNLGASNRHSISKNRTGRLAGSLRDRAAASLTRERGIRLCAIRSI
jgi:hypothetical protein